MTGLGGWLPVCTTTDLAGAVIDSRVRVAGRVMKVRDHGAIAFVDLADGLGRVQLVLESLPHGLRRGALLDVEGIVERQGARGSIKVDRVRTHVPSTSTADRDAARLADSLTAEANLVRSRAVSVVHRFFAEGGFLPVASPTIVGEWAVGRTPSFDLDFYGESARLSISNMTAHQQLLALPYPRIYELGKLFRAERPSSRGRLAEFTILDVGMAWSRLDDLLVVVEQLLQALFREVAALSLRQLNDVVSLTFERVTVDNVVAAVGPGALTGSQFTGPARQWLAERSDGFLWVLGFPEHTRPFYVRTVEGRGVDAQLWYRGRRYLAAGGEREVDPNVVVKKLRERGKAPESYDAYLTALADGAPPMVGMGMGLERLLASCLPTAAVADFTWFPRYMGHLEP